MKNLTALGFVPPLTTLETVDDDAQILGLTAGLGWLVTESSQIYADLQYLGIDSNYAGSTEIGRALVGLQKKVAPSITGIAGAAYDTESELTVGLGLVLRVADDVSANVSYQ